MALAAINGAGLPTTQCFAGGLHGDHLPDAGTAGLACFSTRSAGGGDPFPSRGLHTPGTCGGVHPVALNFTAISPKCDARIIGSILDLDAAIHPGRSNPGDAVSR